MSMFDDNNKNKKNSLGDDIFDGIGSAYPFAKNLSEKITGHTVEGDIKMLKGFSDSEYAEMSIEQLMKFKRKYHTRTIGFIAAAIILIICGISLLFKGEFVTSGKGIFFIVLGAVSFIFGLIAKKQCELIQKHLDVDK